MCNSLPRIASLEKKQGEQQSTIFVLKTQRRPSRPVALILISPRIFERRCCGSIVLASSEPFHSEVIRSLKGLLVRIAPLLRSAFLPSNFFFRCRAIKYAKARYSLVTFSTGERTSNCTALQADVISSNPVPTNASGWEAEKAGEETTNATNLHLHVLLTCLHE